MSRSHRNSDLWSQYGQMAKRADELLELYAQTIDRAEVIRKEWDAISREDHERRWGTAPASPAPDQHEGSDQG